jgi:hypothetical protein
MSTKSNSLGTPATRRNPSDYEIHAQSCPVKNSKSALFLVASFSVMVFVGWKGLHRAPEHKSIVELLFYIVVAAGLARLLAAFTCLRERLVISVVIVSLLTGAATGFVPSVFSQHVEMVKFGELALSLLGLLVSLTMLVQSARSRNVGRNDAAASIARQPKQNLPILLVVILTVLVLGALLYFLPFRQ